MITEADILTIHLSPAELSFLRRQSQRAEVGGKSNIREQGERIEKLSEDQLIGQIGTYAGIRALFGNPFLYRVSRYYANIYPMLGDGGSDVPGANIDFKASMRRSGRGLLEYRLAVRPKERHEGMIYVLVLVELEPCVAHLIGWASEDMLPKETETEGVFKGAHLLPAASLKPLMRIEWFRDAL